MRIAIISDVHNNIANLKKILDYCRDNEIEKIICCGDLASLETLDFLNDNFAGENFYCFGNMDDGQMTNKVCHPDPAEAGEGSRSNTASNNTTGFLAELGMTCRYKNTRVFKNFGETEFGSLASKKYKIAFTHYPENARELCESGKYDFVFYGHTHKPWEETVKNCKMLNPGNVAGEIYPPTFCAWDTVTNNFSLVRIHDLK